MKKIEKLEDNITDKGHLVAGIEPSNNRQLMDKVNELIDAINELQGEATRKKKLVPFGGYGVNTLQGEATSGYVETVGTPMLESTTTSNPDEEKPDRICVRCGALETEAKEIDCIVGGNCYDKHDFAEEKPEKLYIGTEKIKEPRMRKLTEQEFQDLVDRYTQPEEFTLEELEDIYDVLETDLDSWVIRYGRFKGNDPMCVTEKIINKKQRAVDKLSKMIQEYE